MTETKQMTAAEAVRNIRSGDRVYIGTSSSFAYELLDALYDRKDELEDITLLCAMSISPCRMFDTDWPADIPAGHKGNPFIFDTFFLGAGERKAHRKHNMAFAFTSFHLSQIDLWMREVGRPDISFLQVSRPDDDGNFSFSSAGICDHKYVVEETKRDVFLESNTGSPYVFGQDNLINADHPKVSGIVYTDKNAPELLPDEIDDISKQISEIVVKEVPDGATLQLGLGKMSTAIGYDLKQKNDLGIFSELFSQPMMMLMKNGNVNNSRKGFMDGKSVFSFSAGTQEMYDFMDRNPEIYGAPFPFVNDARNIAKNRSMISINSAMAVDLYGQVAADAIGYSQQSAVGGQLDFVKGAQWSEGGKSIIALSSSFMKHGKRQSKISLQFAPGTPVTTPRSEVQYVATEYGCVNLKVLNMADRVRAMISLAHPDFRDQLTQEAKDAGLI
ncbi:MAG: acetyl-CoA hydrolase/transferase C-terminal domain-containing protein [Bacillota bacterium]|nr:acetyl-CoA hydrolase/transferase C-terminal domain-containing protein [Bacillota bacterium]